MTRLTNLPSFPRRSMFNLAACEVPTELQTWALAGGDVAGQREHHGDRKGRSTPAARLGCNPAPTPAPVFPQV